jgi:hypothetical protein
MILLQGWRFATTGPGNPDAMPDSDVPSDEVPVADAVEQRQDTAGPVPDEEVSTDPTSDVPLEASGADWQEQREEVVDTDDDYDRG